MNYRGKFIIGPKSQRFSLKTIPIAFTANGENGNARIDNILTGGLLVDEASSQPSPGEKIQVFINVPDFSSPVALEAVVVRRQNRGFAAKFSGLSEETRVSLASYFSSAVEKM